MKIGNKIRIVQYYMGHPLEKTDHTVEEFRHCLGIFLSDNAREASKFTPLCNLFEPGPESEQQYISNYGEYHTNEVQAWMDLPND